MARKIGQFAARAAAAFCLVFAAFQIALALGAPYGEVAWGGSDRVLPLGLRLASLGAAVYLVLAAGAMLVRSRDLARRWPQTPFRWFNAFLALQLALNTVANLAARSSGERLGMGAASALGCLLCIAALFLKQTDTPGAATR